MDKITVYIDFEVISNPFAWELKFREISPYAYSIGIFVDKKFKTKTYIVNFNNVYVKDIYMVLKKRIEKDIQNIIKNDNFVISAKTTEFAAYNLNLEKKILDRIFNNIDIIDISGGKQISLWKATEREMGKKVYFEEFKKIINKNLEKDFIKKRGLDKDGAIAALAGYVLYSNSYPNQNYKYKININSYNLLKEIKNYSKDDVIRMTIIVNNYELFYSKSKKWTKIIKENTINNKRIRENKIIIKELKKVNSHQTIGIYLNDLDEKSKKLEALDIKKEIL